MSKYCIASTLLLTSQVMEEARGQLVESNKLTISREATLGDTIVSHRQVFVYYYYDSDKCHLLFSRMNRRAFLEEMASFNY
jgi:hypothetical protein